MKVTNVYGLTSDLSESAPAVQDSGLAYDSGDSSLSWTKAGYQSLVIASRVPINFSPKDGVTYPVGPLSPYTFIIYRGVSNEIDIDLDPEEDWYYQTFAFNGVQSTEKYNRVSNMIFVPRNLDIPYILREDDYFMLREDGSKFIREEYA